MSAVTGGRKRQREGSWLRPSVSTSAVLGGTGPAGVVRAAGSGRRRPDVARLKTDERSSRERLRAAALRRREYSCQPAGRDACQVLSLSLGEDLAPLELPYVAKTLGFGPR